MDRLQIREAEIFRVLKRLNEIDFVLIGGYAVNSYALPRFSEDCDIVIRKKDVPNAKRILENEGYTIVEGKTLVPYHGEFSRFEKRVAENIHASIDIMVDKVSDRQTGVSFDADWIFRNSAKRAVIGKTISEKINARIISSDALFVMKFISARTTDIRDIFMMATAVKDSRWVKNEVGLRISFDGQYRKIFEKISSKQFKDNLQGVYGYIDEMIFQKHMELILKLGKTNQ